MTKLEKEKKDMNENILYFWNLLLDIERYPVTHDVTHKTHMMINIRRNAHSLLLQLFYYYSCNNKRYLFIKKGNMINFCVFVYVYVHHYKIPRGCE